MLCFQSFIFCYAFICRPASFFGCGEGDSPSRSPTDALLGKGSEWCLASGAFWLLPFPKQRV